MEKTAPIYQLKTLPKKVIFRSKIRILTFHLSLFLCLSAFSRLQAQTKPALHFKKTNPVSLYSTPDPLDSLGDYQSLLRPASTYNSKRFWLVSGTGAALYGAVTYGLYQTWYSEFERGPFRTFNDWPEWMQMDKGGHIFTAYQYARFAQAASEWTGIKRKKAAWTAFGVSTLFQTTLELLDAYSEEWGFSWSDVGANTLGAGFHLGQELLWQEQRVLIKISSTLNGPPNIPVTNSNGATSNVSVPSSQRYGTGIVERYLKDYNEMTVWLSVNPRSFAPNSKIPPWLNVAFGAGAENVFGAYGNGWRDNGQSFFYDAPQYRQWFLSPDIYFSRIPTKKRWIRLLLGTLDFFKLPAPTLEYSQGRFKGRWLMW